jgi:hypothetical protein
MQSASQESNMANPIPLSERETECLNTLVQTLIGNYGWGNVAQALAFELGNWSANWREGEMSSEKLTAMHAMFRVTEELRHYGNLTDNLGVE